MISDYDHRDRHLVIDHEIIAAQRCNEIPRVESKFIRTFFFIEHTVCPSQFVSFIATDHAIGISRTSSNRPLILIGSRRFCRSLAASSSPFQRNSSMSTGLNPIRRLQAAPFHRFGNIPWLIACALAPGVTQQKVALEQQVDMKNFLPGKRRGFYQGLGAARTNGLGSGLSMALDVPPRGATSWKRLLRVQVSSEYATCIRYGRASMRNGRYTVFAETRRRGARKGNLFIEEEYDDHRWWKKSEPMGEERRIAHWLVTGCT